MHLYGYEVGPAILETSRMDRRFYIILGIGAHYEENEVGLAWMWTRGSCAELDGVGGDREILPMA